MTISVHFGALSCALFLASTAWAQVTLTPFTTFGGGDGWLAPTDNALLTATGDNARGMDYNALTDHLYFVHRTGTTITIPILDTAGAQLGTLDTTGISGGTFALSKIAVADDGVIYGAGLRTGAVSATTNYKIYSWNAEGSAPANIFNVIPNGESRIGDDLDVTGTGANTRLVAGYQVSGTATTVPNINSYAVIDPTASAATPTTPVYNNIAFSGTPPNTGDFRLGITFLSGGASGTVLGTQGGTTNSIQNPARLTSYNGSTGTLDGSFNLTTINERPMDYALVGGLPLLATMEVGGSATAPLASSGTVHLYDMTNPAAPVELTTSRIQTTTNPNTNFAGDVRFGEAGVDANGNPTMTLYALNTNNGIQAFVVTVPEPSTGLFVLSSALVACLRRRRL